MANNGPPPARTVARIGFLKAIGSVLAGGATLVLAVAVIILTRSADEQRNESNCRFGISTEVNSIADNIDALTAEIFVAAIQDPAPGDTPNPEVTRLASELDEEISRLRPAIEAREQSVTDCQES